MYGAVKIGERTYRVKTTLKYDNAPSQKNNVYSYEVIKIELLDESNSSGSSMSSALSGHRMKTTNLLNGVKKSYDNELNILNSSKVVDENGEPLVVYHGTPQKEITTFDRSKIGSSNDPGIYGRGFYFTSISKMADQYRRGFGDKIVSFLDFKNPLRLDTFKSKEELAEYLGIDLDL